MFVKLPLQKRFFFYSFCCFLTAFSLTRTAEAIVMGDDFAAKAVRATSHREVELPMRYGQLRGNPAREKNKKILERALGLPKKPAPPQAGITNLPGASYPSYGDIPLLVPYPGAKLMDMGPQPPAPPPYPGGPSAPGLYGNHAITEPNTP